ncbi:hypothetical protein DSECCO2_180410 [anaerobic digester metagenome]
MPVFVPTNAAVPVCPVIFTLVTPRFIILALAVYPNSACHGVDDLFIRKPLITNPLPS